MFKHPGLPRVKFRNSNQKVSRWLLPVFERLWFNNIGKLDTVHAHPINDSFNLFRLVQENEVKHGIQYLSEGLITTYPTKKFIDAFLSRMEKHVPEELRGLKFSDIDPEGDETQMFGYTAATREVNGVSSMVSFPIPVRTDELSEFKNVVISKVDTMYVYGYDLSSISELGRSNDGKVVVLVIQFEARHPTDRFEMSEELYHVSSLRHLPKIRKQGLVPKSKSEEFKYDDRVYLFNNHPLSSILDYGIWKSNQEKDDGFCLFKIERNNLKNLETFKNGKLTFYVDGAFDNQSGVDAIFTYGNIPLSVIDDTCLIYRKDDGYSNPEKLNFKKMAFQN